MTDDLAYDVFARACPSRGTLEHVTGRWGSLTLGALYDGTFRFNELRRRVDGVSEKMLSQTLHALERDGLVHRDAQPTNPPRVDYRL
ncbi:winged helix-turn-helix transcriptional regulator, partial [Streptomyces narbonensis]